MVPPVESPEHAFARTRFESAKQEFDESQKEYNQLMEQNPRCKAFPELIRNPVTTNSLDAYMFGCNYETRKARYIMDKISEVLVQFETQLKHVDDCLTVYRITIDKKFSDQTKREVEQIKMCQTNSLFPSQTK